MKYIEIDFYKIEGYGVLSLNAQKMFKYMYEKHNSGQGNEFKKDWIPVKVIEHKTYLEVHFKNKQWLHFYIDGTWG